MLWFLDWSFGSFIVIVSIIIFSSLVYMLDSYFKGTLNETKARIVCSFFVFLMFFLIFISFDCLDKRTFSLYPKEHYFISKIFNKKYEYGITLGELWCNYIEYNGELCKNYVDYALNNQKITALKKQNDELEKQIKLEKEKAQKDKIRANYEKTLKEIVEKGDLKWKSK